VRAQAAAKNPIAQLELDDPGIVADIDTLQDLANAERLLAEG
jgi:GTP:adenosylcobinamide-phosphate guanylyltransferase